VQIYVPMIPSKYDLQKDDGLFNYKVLARLKPGVSVE
jgi:hypothetical protein